MVTPADIRAYVDTDLDDASIQKLIDAESEAIENAVGAASAVDMRYAYGLPVIVLSRPAASIDSVVERASPGDQNPVTLDSLDYRQIDAYRLWRLSSGPNPAGSWGAEVTVTYTPKVSQALRDRVLIQLVQMAIEFSASSKEGVEGATVDQADFHERRQGLLAQLNEGTLPVL